MKKVGVSIMLVALMALCLCCFVRIDRKARLVFADEQQSIDLLANEVIDQTGVGLSVNVLTANGFSDFSTGYNVLNSEWLQNQTLNRISYNFSSSQTHKSIHYADIVSDFSVSFKNGSTVENKVLLVAATNNLSNNSSINFANTSFKYYANYTHVIKKYRLYITDYLNKSTYANAFSSNFLADLDKVKNNTLTAESFLSRYGTHIVGAAVFGGRLNATFTLASNKIVIGGAIKSALDSSINFNDVQTLTQASAYNAISGKLGASYTSSDLLSCFNVTSIGGNAFAANTSASFNTGYSSWTNSLNQSDANSVVVDYENDGLVAIWNILPDEYQSVANSLKAKFNEKYNSSYNEFSNKFKTGDYKNFAGGVGDSENPYLVSTLAQLRNVEKNMAAHYKMINSISLKNTDWVPLGGCYRATPFIGVFDGANYNITDLTKTTSVSESNNRYYYGLFGSIGSGGVVKSINFNNTNINITANSGNNGSSRIFIGTVAGSVVEGTIEGCNINGTCAYNVCVSGITYFGSVCGLSNNATIKNCINRANVTVGRYTCAAGGIAGYARKSSFYNCTNYGSISATCTAFGGYAFSGGIAGTVYEYEANTFSSCNGGDISKITVSDYGGWFSATKTRGVTSGGTTRENCY